MGAYYPGGQRLFEARPQITHTYKGKNYFMFQVISRQMSNSKLRYLKSNLWDSIQNTVDSVENQIQKHFTSRNKFFEHDYSSNNRRKQLSQH